jgi:hypothetical protein
VNLSLKNRVVASFIVANMVVIVISAIVFNYLNSLNKDIETIAIKSNQVSLSTDEIRISAITILKRQRELLSEGANQEKVTRLISLCESFTGQLKRLDSLYQAPEIKKVIAQMISYVDSLTLVLGKAAIYGRDNAGMATLGELADKILDTFSDLQEIQFDESVERELKIKKIINETKRNMMITLIIAFLGTIILGLVVPGKIALPFKKIRDAIRELQDCNFDVSIYYTQSDEIGEIATEMNKMIQSFKMFDALRADRVNVEKRKFDALANMIKKPVLVANANHEVIYMNSKMYSLIAAQSEDIIGKNMVDTILPESIVESFELAIKRRSKIENSVVKITASRSVESENDEVRNGESSVNESGEVIHVAEVVEETLFEGYSTVIPIRGKESSLDYYLMVLSNEVFA